MTADEARPQGEQVIAEDSVYRLGFAAVRHVITRDPQLPDGPFRTLIHYYEYAQRSDLAWPSVGTVAKALGKGVRTIVRHRQALVSLGYIELIADPNHPAIAALENRQHDVTVVLLKNPGKIKRLKAIAAEVLTKRRATPSTETDKKLFTELTRLGLTRAAGKALIRDYRGDDPLAELVERWVTNRFHIPKSWGVGLVYRKLERGELPPGPKIDTEFLASIKANQQYLVGQMTLPIDPPEVRDDD